jgi:hypothetical protein
MIALVLLSLLVGCLVYSLGESKMPRLELEIHQADTIVCYNGPPREEVVSLQLWPRGPSISVWRQVELRLSTLDIDNER